MKIKTINNMIVLNNGLPFEVKVPTKQTQKALNELDEKKDYKKSTPLDSK